MFKQAIAASALALVATTATTDAQAVALLTEGFDNVAGLSMNGWVLTNQSTPIGSTNWFQGDSTIFVSQAGADSSYIAANYNNAAEGGTLNNLLLSPVFSTAQPGQVSFFARAEIFQPFSDQISYGLNTGGSVATPTTVTLTGGWTQYSLNFAGAGAGSTARFAIGYTGVADTSNYIGIDSVAVTAVPEPAAALLLASGITGLWLLRRRSAISR